jgi:hypothetical protein
VSARFYRALSPQSVSFADQFPSTISWNGFLAQNNTLKVGTMETSRLVDMHFGWAIDAPNHLLVVKVNIRED